MLVLKTKAFVSKVNNTDYDHQSTSLESSLVKPHLDERNIEFAELMHHLFPNAIFCKISLTFVYQLFQTFAIYWYMAIMIFQVADQIKFIINPTSSTMIKGIDFFNLLASAGISAVIFLLCMMTRGNAAAVRDNLADHEGIVVRVVTTPELPNHLRISVGRPQDTDALMRGLLRIAEQHPL